MNCTFGKQLPSHRIYGPQSILPTPTPALRGPAHRRPPQEGSPDRRKGISDGEQLRTKAGSSTLFLLRAATPEIQRGGLLRAQCCSRRGRRRQSRSGLSADTSVACCIRGADALRFRFSSKASDLIGEEPIRSVEITVELIPRAQLSSALGRRLRLQRRDLAPLPPPVVASASACAFASQSFGARKQSRPQTLFTECRTKHGPLPLVGGRRVLQQAHLGGLRIERDLTV